MSNKTSTSYSAAELQALGADVAKVGRYARITGTNLSSIALELAEKEAPELLRKYYPRTYENIGQYHSPKILAAYLTQLTCGLRDFGYEEAPTGYRVLAPALSALIKHNIPTYFLSPSFLDAVKRTDLKDDIDWVNLPLPFEEGVLVLPRGVLPGPEGDTGFLLWSRKRPGVYGVPEAGPVQLEKTTFALHALCPDTGCWFDSTLRDDVRPTLRLNNLFYRAAGEPVPTHVNNVLLDEILSEADAPYIEQLGVVLFGSLLAMLARPELLEPAQRLKVIPAKKDKPAREFWSPNFVGRKYIARVAKASAGTHASPRMHWRRGHFRNQAVGAGRKERKVIWVEPVLVAAVKEENAGKEAKV